MKPAKEYIVFLIDDDPLHLQLLGRAMRQLNTIVPDVKSFTNVEDALDSITVNAKDVRLLPDYIFLDINMPGMDGWQFLSSLQLLKTSMVKKPVIYMLSASDDEQDLDMLNNYPEVKRYLTKPIKKQDLSRAFY